MVQDVFGVKALLFPSILQCPVEVVVLKLRALVADRGCATSGRGARKSLEGFLEREKVLAVLADRLGSRSG